MVYQVLEQIRKRPGMWLGTLSISTSGWDNLILEKCGGDQKAALEQFYKYLDEFRSLKVVNMKKEVLTEENILANDNMLYSCIGGVSGHPNPLSDKCSVCKMKHLCGIFIW